MGKNEIIYKICKCCGQRKEEFQFSTRSRSGENETSDSVTGDVCKVCVKRGMPSKEARINNIREKLAAIRLRSAAREKKEREAALRMEELELL